MKILVNGSESDLSLCREKFGSSHQYVIAERERSLIDASLVIDFLTDTVSNFPENIPLLVNSPLTSLLTLVSSGALDRKRNVFGFNGLPGFFGNESLEVSLLNNDERPALESVMQKLNTGFVLVEDRVGMVTPRIICMIINEAYYTVQEKTASKSDVDMAMKLGTNYPYGPFEWCERIGIANVYSILEAVYHDTHDERYRIAPLLKQEYLRAARG